MVEWCEGVLLVDADNAYANRLNRKTALHNIQQICPPLYKYLNNSYNTPAKLYLKDGSFILSEEGVTQGDNLAMATYALSTKTLIDTLRTTTNKEKIRQMWFADDSAGGGTLDALKMWWNHLSDNGPAYGYYPKPPKTHLILKNPEDLNRAQNLFGVDGVKITCEGERHIGAVIS